MARRIDAAGDLVKSSVRRLGTGLVVVLLTASACVVELEGPRPSPYGHPNEGIIRIRTEHEHVCWSLVSYEEKGPLRLEGCGDRDVPTYRVGSFAIAIIKRDDTDGELSAMLESGGRIIHRGTSREKRDIIRLYA